MVVREKRLLEKIRKSTHRAQPDPVFAQSRHHEGENTRQMRRDADGSFFIRAARALPPSVSVCLCVCVCVM